MKCDRGIKGRDDKSRVIEILITEVFVKVNPTEPLILAYNRPHEGREIDPIPPVFR
jgi:hypothetical protein